MGFSRDLIEFLIAKKIPIRLAIEILEQAEEILQRKTKEKAIAKGYEKR